MQVTVKINQNEAKKAIQQAFLAEMDDFLTVMVRKLRQPCRDIIYRNIAASPEVKSLDGGDLQSALGVAFSSVKLDALLKIWSDSLEIFIRVPKLSGGLVRGGLDIRAVRADYGDVLSQNEAFYISERSKSSIHWLNWLLTRGTEDIVLGYNLGVDVKHIARTGLGEIMIRSVDSFGLQGGLAQYAGTENDNFVTRSLVGAAKEIEGLIVKELT